MIFKNPTVVPKKKQFELDSTVARQMPKEWYTALERDAPLTGASILAKRIARLSPYTHNIILRLLPDHHKLRGVRRGRPLIADQAGHQTSAWARLRQCWKRVALQKPLSVGLSRQPSGMAKRRWNCLECLSRRMWQQTERRQISPGEPRRCSQWVEI